MAQTMVIALAPSKDRSRPGQGHGKLRATFNLKSSCGIKADETVTAIIKYSRGTPVDTVLTEITS